jgi:hypothetical protein
LLNEIEEQDILHWASSFPSNDHPWSRKRASFVGTVEIQEKPWQFTHEELKQQLEKVKDVRPGKHPLPQGNKRKQESKK